ncbi:MAG: hydrogen gas-evolving membrane-bound hydrogenase subunit E [Desulfobacterales bacterium]
MTRKHGDSLDSRTGKMMAAISVLALTSVLGWTVWTLPPFSDRMQRLVSSNMAVSGVENPVTAVLLNFRGYDTLLEIGVLLLAALSVLSVVPSPAIFSQSPPSPILILLLRLLLPFIIIVAGYILWIGKYAPGGAFQAGAILAAGGILLSTAAVTFNRFAIKAMPFAMTIGLLTFIVVALATMMVHGNFLQYPLAQAGPLILVIEAAATISIAIILTILFVGGNPEESSTAKDEGDKAFIIERDNATK